MTTSSIQAPAEHIGGGLPTPRSHSNTVTVTRRAGGTVTVTVWDTCDGVAGFVESLLGPPASSAQVETS